MKTFSCYDEPMKSISKTTFMLFFITILAVAEGIGLFLVWDKNSQTESKILDISQQLTETTATIEANRMMAINESQWAREAIKPLYNSAKNTLMMPELGIEMPYNDISKTIEYVVDGDNIRVTSNLLVDYSYSRQMSCTQVLRVNFKSDEVYNPWEELYASVDLGGEKKMHLLTIKPFKNNEGSTEECEKEVWNRTTPKQIADEFKSATIL